MTIQSHSTLYFSFMPASTGISTGNMPDSAQIYRGKFTNSTPADAVVAALAGSECRQPGTASVQLRIWL
ncbi:hypothetical protein V6N11_051740 [Hibiscus sabdariffa]|uniref:Uncharacterized protein n=1 Tax=Hibiscus sabdariffa TaxID=183260 RepID=A0ABR2U841_9ROSI